MTDFRALAIRRFMVLLMRIGPRVKPAGPWGARHPDTGVIYRVRMPHVVKGGKDDDRHGSELDP